MELAQRFINYGKSTVIAPITHHAGREHLVSVSHGLGKDVLLRSEAPVEFAAEKAATGECFGQELFAEGCGRRGLISTSALGP